ncbi:thioester domain-containing protein [Nocardiopsis alborubida]|uniref:Cys-Gln thioester bond-forming surface protein n=1 Tax=Nocardiopsis alborubida TaxID=146802 RepID=A0A7X6RS52_9ACTN|nr:thioester domain-containing protein [Nocardiopsis alborubida]NKY99967.1 Cys-Gln thioester bond-forming surface protein [Nocardiopsis alborubida]
MTYVSLPHSVGRATLAASAAALLAFGLAAPASADPVETYEGSVRAQYPATAASGVDVRVNGAMESTSLFDLRLEDGTALTAYCIDLETKIKDNAWYLEDDWANYPGRGDFAEPGKVHWILQNSYPTVSAAQLAENAGLNRGNARHFGDEEAIAATQAAIWHFSNGSEATANDPNGVKAVYDYLVGEAQDLPQEPGPTLSITPGEATGSAGETIGEFLVETSDEDGIEVSVQAPEGVEVQLVDLESGEPVTTVNNGDTVGLAVPEGAAEGTASFSLETTATVRSGRLFKGEEEYQPTQTLITAEDSDVTVSASASVSWTGGGETPPESPEPSEPESPEPSEPESPEPTPSDEPSEPTDKPSEPADDQNEPSLPVTGGALAGLVAAGVAALGAGGGALYLSRRRKAADSQDLEG